jgi:transposase
MEGAGAGKANKSLYYGAIDLHSNNSVLGIINAGGERLCKQKLPNDLGVIQAALIPFAAELQGIVVESTFNWYWLVDGLQEGGYRVHLANTTAAKQYSGLKHTDDESDALWLADLLRLGLLKEGHVYPRQERAVRDLMRKRTNLVQQRTRNILSIQNLTSRNRGVRLSGNQVKQLTAETVEEAYENEEDLALAVSSSLRIVEALDREIKIIEKRVKGKVNLSQPYQLLQTVSGIGEILAMTIMLEAGDMCRFPTVGDFSSYCRCVSSTRLSNGKKKGSGNSKNGNPYLSWAFMEAANFAIRYNPVIRRFYQRKSARSKIVVARKAVAHKLARASYYVLRDQVPFDVTKCFGH